MLTIDTIVRTRLLKDRRSMHWYVEYLVHAITCLRELGFDVMGKVNTKKISVDASGQAKFPCDYHDFIKVGVPAGQYVRPLLQYDKISNLSNYNNSGEIVPYNANADTDLLSPYIYNNIYWYNTYGEYKGGRFGYGQGRERDTFKIIKERKVFQLDEHVNADCIILEYISDGTDCDAATQVDPYAQIAIENYIVWQYKECNRNYGIGERQLAKRAYDQSVMKLVARLDPITIEDVKRVSRRGYYAANKE